MDLVEAPFPGLNFLTATRQSTTFNSAMRLFRQEEKFHDEALALLYKLASEGHIESIYEFFFICIDQSEFDVAAEVLNQEKTDANHSTIIYLKALLLMEQGNFNVTAFAKAAEAGSAMAAIRLVEHFLPTDKEEAKNWLAKAKKIGHKDLEYYQNEVELFPKKKSFIVINGSDDSNTYSEVRVYSNDDYSLIEKFNNQESAINFCLENNQGIENASFEFRDVGDEWPDESDLAYDDPFSLSCKVIPEKNEIVIWKDYEVLWRGTTYEMSEAIEYLIENTDEWWELVFCDYERFEAEDADEVESEAELLPLVSQLPLGSDVYKTLESATSPSTSPDILEKLSSHHDLEVRCAVAWNNKTSLNALHELAKDIYEEVRFCVASNSSTNLDTLTLLSLDESEFVKDQAKFKIYELAGNPHTSPETLAKLAEYADEIARSSVARNPGASPETVAMLAKDLDWSVRASVAENPITSPDLLTVLAKNHDLTKDEDELVRECVAKNPNTSSATLAILAKDLNWSVRTSVAKNPNANPELLAVLAEDHDEDSVRASAAENPNTSPETLAMLAQDDEESVRASVARNQNTSPETLAMLAQDDEESVRASVARNQNTSPETLAMLAQDDEDEDIRRSVAENPNASPETLALLAEAGEDEQIWMSVAQNPNASPETLAMLAEDEYGFGVIVRWYVARNQNTSPETLAMLAEDDHEDTRRSVAENPNTSPETLAMLAEDPAEGEVEDFFTGRIIQGIILSPLVLIGKFQVESGFAMVGDPCHLDEWKADNQWKTTLTEEPNLDDFGEFSFAGAYATVMNSEMWAENLGIDSSVVFRTFRDGIFNVYAKFNEEGRLIKVVIDLELGDSDLTSGVVLEDLQWIGSFGVDSGQATVGDPCYLDGWNTNDGEAFELDGKQGDYSYHGASATTISNSAGVLGDGKSVVFNTGYGDGSYPVYAEVDQNSDRQILKIFIDFSPEE